MDRNHPPTNAEFKSETTRMLKTLKHQLDVIQSDISSIKRDIFLLKTVREVKSETVHPEPKVNTTKEQEYSGGWRLW